MPYPLFIDFEASSYEEDSYPIAVSWSLPDGQIKSVLIIPEDDWTDWDPGNAMARGITREHLFEQGFSALDVIREMNEDLADAQVFIDGLDYDQELLDRLFEAYGETPAFELVSVGELFRSYGYEHFLEFREQLFLATGMSPYDSESNVLAMLKLADELGLQD